MAANILVIEDNPSNLELMSYLLEAFGYSVTTAETASEGLAHIRSRRPDLVICDIHLPGVSGYEVARQLKQDAATKHIPLLAVTALAMVGDRETVLQAGFNGYIAKPVTPELLVKQVEAFLSPDQHSQTRPKVHRDPPAPKIASLISREATILVVDSVALNIQLLKNILEPFGYRVATAATLQEAVSACERFAPDLIIADTHVSDSVGYDLLERIQHLDFLHRRPVLFLSSCDEAHDRWRVGDTGARKLVSRPIEPEPFLQEVAAALGRAEGAG